MPSDCAIRCLIKKSIVIFLVKNRKSNNDTQTILLQIFLHNKKSLLNAHRDVHMTKRLDKRRPLSFHKKVRDLFA